MGADRADKTASSRAEYPRGYDVPRYTLNQINKLFVPQLQKARSLVLERSYSLQRIVSYALLLVFFSPTASLLHTSPPPRSHELLLYSIFFHSCTQVPIFPASRTRGRETRINETTTATNVIASAASLGLSFSFSPNEGIRYQFSATASLCFRATIEGALDKLP